MRTHLDLFSGIGGFSLAARWAGFTTVGFCEIDPFCQKVLAKNFPGVPIHAEIQTLTGATIARWLGSSSGAVADPDRREQPQEQDGASWGRTEDGQGGGVPALVSSGVGAGGGTGGGHLAEGIRRRVAIEPERPELPAIDLLTGGFPCQPFSAAGKRKGKEDDRHLWPEMARVVAEVRPRWVLAENVAGFVSMGLDDCLFDLEGLGYEAWAVVVPACAVGAPHRRDRVWIVAHRERERRDGQQDASAGYDVDRHHAGRQEASRRPEQRREDAAYSDDQRQSTLSRQEIGQRVVDGGPAVADAARELLDRAGLAGTGWWAEPANGDWWAAEPAVDRMAHGVPNRVDRLRSLGNAIVPAVAYEFLRLMP